MNNTQIVHNEFMYPQYKNEILYWAIFLLIFICFIIATLYNKFTKKKK